VNTREVSVVLPTWNRVQFLRATIESVLTQTVAIRELIVADDGSDAPTRAVLEQYAAVPGVRVLWRDHGGNPGAGRNAAIRAASGRYIAFADSDDVWHARKLERQLAALQARPASRWSYTSWTCIDAQDRPIALPGSAHPRARTASLVESLATFAAQVPLPSVLAERALLLEAGLFDESFGCYADYDLWIRLAARSDAVAIPEPLVYVRLHDKHFSRGRVHAATSGRDRYLEHAIRLIRDPSVRARVQRMRALDSARLAGMAAIAGDASETARRLRASLVHGWTMPRWWFIAARAQVHRWTRRGKRIRASGR
jgi:glycosyltransferase involved in cell wall biosynthesis